MSAEAVGYVFRHSPFKGATFACHLAAADSVNDQHGNELFMSASTLATKARVARPTASTALAALTTAGFLVAMDPPMGVDDEGKERRWHRPRRYVFVFADAPVFYESRRRRKQVSAEMTPAISGEVSPPVTPHPSSQVSPPTTPGVTTDDTRCQQRRHPYNPTEPNRTQGATPPRRGPRTQHAAVAEAQAAFRADWLSTHHDAEPASDWLNAAARAARRALADSEPLELIISCLGVCAKENKHPRALGFVLADYHRDHAEALT